MIPIHQITGRLGNQMFQFAFIYGQMKKGLIPDTYLQSHKYFEGVEDDIKQLFGQGIGYLPFVSIHVRRGDYVNHPFYVDLTTTDYYHKAIDKFSGKKFLVFSDDPEFCKSLPWITDDFQIMEGGTELEDMNQMASCEHNIIANSSFSWWCGFLNPHPNKQVIYPSRWFTDNIERVGFPKGWIKI